MNSILSSAKNIITKIDLLDDYIDIYNEQDNIIKTENAKETPDAGVISSATSKRDDASSKFSKGLAEVQNDFTALKSMDSNCEISSLGENAEAGTDFEGISMADLKNLTPGSYTEHSYIGSNGREVKYWIYVPENINTATGLPVTVYMCGACEKGKNCNNNSLPLYVKNGTVNPEGIVITLVTNDNAEYTNPQYLTTCKEIVDNVVTTYEADTNRISISGHSNGGRGVLAFSARYPDYFSVCVPVCGFSNSIKEGVDSRSTEEVLSNLSTTHIVAVTGNNDSNSKSSMNSLYQLIKDSGNMSLEILKGYSHTDTYHKYYEPIEIEGKQYNSLLEYLFSCTKA
jgi:predicted alpha/beta superfamily hydrolase